MDDETTTTTLASLEAEYCPPLDPALLSAIVSDFDLSAQGDVQHARRILDSLRESAALEEAVGFDASGTGGVHVMEDESTSRSKVRDGTSSTKSHETDLSNLSEHMSSLDLEHHGPLHDLEVPQVDIEEDIETLDRETKLQLLDELFGKHISRTHLEYTLGKCGGKWNNAMDEILNQVYFGEAGGTSEWQNGSAKGIDGFFNDGETPRSRKGKQKEKRMKKSDERRTSSLPGNEEQSSPVANKWETAAKDIDFIASRTGIKSATVGSMYYETGGSMPKTIAALIRASREESKYVVTDGVAVSSRGRELAGEFPTASPEDLTVLVRLAHPSSTAARELATALTTKSPTATGGIRIVPQYLLPADIEGSSEWSPVLPKSKSAASSPRISMDVESAATRKERYDLAKAAAVSQARAAARRAKSNHLMSGAVAVYSERHREYAELSARASAAAADELASVQSTATQVDLHGMDVANAVRIAQDKVEEWWEGLGESRVNGRVGAGDRRAGYTIIVGVGRHSEGGKGKLGPAVSKMLKAQGWRTEPSTAGVIVVKGPLRK